jgi:hypothetical protein
MNLILYFRNISYYIDYVYYYNYKIDRHGCSTFSDGVLRPDELVRRAALRGASVLAPTDVGRVVAGAGYPAC